MKSFYLLLALILRNEVVSAFVGTTPNAFNRGQVDVCLAEESGDISTSRREWMRDVSIAAFGLGSALSPPNIAQASGGATAGGAYLLSAKQRYNKRVTASVQAFLACSASIESGKLDSIKAFLASEDEGGWKDVTTAGYLLANAFRTNSTTAPDKLPSVKKWKAFVAEVEAIKKALKKKDVKGVQSSYETAVAALDEYLSAVELPSVIEMRG